MEFVANKLYNDYYDQIKEVIGDQSTFSSDLTKVGRKIFGKKYLGTFAADEIPKMKKNDMLIANLDKKGEAKKEHWVAMYKSNGKVYFYDSFGRGYKIILPNVENLNENIEDTALEAEQKIDQYDCGLRCLSWLCVPKFNGMKYAKLI